MSMAPTGRRVQHARMLSILVSAREVRNAHRYGGRVLLAAPTLGHYNAMPPAWPVIGIRLPNGKSLMEKAP